MNKRLLNHYRHKLVSVKAVYLLLPAVIFGALAIYGLRSNYATMVELREAVYVADRDNGDVEGALQALRSHVHGHMNTNLASGDNPIKPPIQLKTRYERLAAGEQERVKNLNAQVVAQGEAVCGQQFPGAGFNAPRVSCIQDYVAAHGVKQQSIPEQLYKFDFVSPRWSPDLAGISLVLSAFFSVLFLTRFIVLKVSKQLVT